MMLEQTKIVHYISASFAIRHARVLITSVNTEHISIGSSSTEVCQPIHKLTISNQGRMGARFWLMLGVAVVVMVTEGGSLYIPPPGLATRITPSGFKFLQDVAVEKVEDMARGRSIPSQSGQSGALSYDVWNMEIEEFIIGDYLIRSQDCQAVLVSLSDIYVHISGQYSYSCLVFHGSGPFDAYLSNMAISMQLWITADSYGRPKVTSSDCGFNAGQVDVQLHNEWGWISGKASDHLKDFLNENTCDLITDAINTQIDSRLSQLTMLKKFYEGLELDYSLLSNPNVTSYKFDTIHKGEVYAIGHHSEDPVDQPFIPLDQESTSMVYVWISDYLLNSACYVLHDNDYLQYNITQQDIPEGSKFSLNTSGLPLSEFFPKIHSLYPNMMTVFQVSSTKGPVIRTTKDKMTLTAYGDVEAYVIQQNGTLDYLFTLGVNLTVSALFAIKKHNLTWKANYESVHLELEDTVIPDMNIKILQKLLPLALKASVIPMVNKMGSVGKPLPTFQDYHANATKITLGTGFLKIGTDFRLYNPIEETIEDLFNSLF